MKVRDNAVIDQEAIYARVIGLIVSQRELDLTDVVSCELAAYPPSMFKPDRSSFTACRLLLIKYVWRTALPLKHLFGYGDSPVLLLWMSQQLCGHYFGPHKVLSKY